MSWLNSELPADWPSKKGSEQTNSDLDFSTSQSEGTMNVEPTVAIQADATSGTEPWRHAIQAPENESQESQPRLTRLFVPPPNFLPEKNSNHTQETTESSLSHNSSSSGQHTTRDESNSVQSPPSRRLKVFGRPDTYTNERLGNLLSSMGGANHASEDRSQIDRSTMGGRSSRGTANMSANESDADLADQLQSEGRKVLQGLAPLHTNLAPVQESSLDQLEQQLTARDSDKFQSVKFDTTSSLLESDSGNTLDSLPAGLSNWDTMGAIPHHMLPNANRLHRTSSQTLVGSGSRQGKKREAEIADLEAEISALGIQEPYADPHVDSNHEREQYPQEINTESVDEISSSQPMESASSRQQSPISTSQRSSSVQSRISSSDTNVRQSSASGSEYLYNPAARDHAAAQLNTRGLYDVTPDTIVRRNLQFRRPTKESVLAGSPANRHTHRPVQYRDFSRSPPPQRSISTQRSSYNEQNINSTPDQSIAVKNMSFSAGFELLAELIRERAPVPGMNIEDIDSLDLSASDLESIVGLDQFVPQLTALFLNDNKIRSLEGLPFNLVHLDLSSNNLSFLNMFPTSFVSTLILTNNEMRDLEPLANLRALSSLDISDNQLTSLKGIENLTALRTLNVNNNQLTSLEVNLGMLSELSAANNNISAVRINAPNLESLNLEGNRVVALSEPFPNLRELNLRFNDATVDFSGYESLETVLFDGNVAMINIEQIASNLVTFSWEKYKGFSGPRPRLPQALLTSVRDLKLGGSSQMGWPFGSGYVVHSVQHLDLANSGIRELPLNFCKQFPFLKSANLSFNKLTDDCIKILAACPNLERLSLFGNRLRTSGESLVRKMPQLRVLDSRSQNRAQNFVQTREFPTEVYTPLEDMVYNSNQDTLVRTRSKELQWLDGKWTNNAGTPKPTTRPAFPSALYPTVWNPPAREMSKSVFNETMDTSMVGALEPWDLVEAMYVHHYLRRHVS